MAFEEARQIMDLIHPDVRPMVELREDPPVRTEAPASGSVAATDSSDSRPLWRATAWLVHERHRGLPPSNVFLHADSAAAARAACEAMFRGIYAKGRLRDPEFRLEVRPSSLSEAESYVSVRRAGFDTGGAVN